MTQLECPKCGGALRYQQIASSSCERCVDCGWLSLGYGHAEVATMCREAKAAREAASSRTQNTMED